MNYRLHKIDLILPKIKNKKKISFSWGFEYRYLQDLTSEVCDLVSSKQDVDRNRLFLIRTPSVPCYTDLTEFLHIMNSFRLTPELACIEGEIGAKHTLYLRGTLAYLLPGQNYLDAIYNLQNDIEISDSTVAEHDNRRIGYDLRIKELISKIYNISEKQIAFNWGSGDGRAIWKELSLKRVRIKLGRPKYDPVYGFFSALGPHGNFQAVQARTYRSLQQPSKGNLQIHQWIGGCPAEHHIIFVNGGMFYALYLVSLQLVKSFGRFLNPAEVKEALERNACKTADYLRRYFLPWAKDNGLDVTQLEERLSSGQWGKLE